MNYFDEENDFMEIEDDEIDSFDEEIVESYVKDTDNIELNDPVIDYSSDDYCKTNCEFYHLCYANHDCCVKQIFEDVLKTLSPRKETIIKMKYGWYDNKKFSYDEIAKKYNISVSYVKNILGHAIKQLRSPVRCKKLKQFVYEVKTVSKVSFYSILLDEIFNMTDLSDDNSLLLGIDLSLIDLEKSANKSIVEIKQELKKSVSEFAELEPYLRMLKDNEINTLDHLLHTSYTKLLSLFGTNDIGYLCLIKSITDMGYKIKGDVKIIDKLFVDELKSVVIDITKYYNKVEDLPLKITLILFEHNITTINEILDNIQNIEALNEIEDNSINIIRNYLDSQKLVYSHNDKNYLLTVSFLTLYFYSLVRWMKIHSKSIFELKAELAASAFHSAELLYQVIERKFPDFDFQASTNVYNILIEDVDFSIRARNCMLRAGIRTLGDIAKRSYEDMLKVRNLGKKCLDEVIEKISYYGIVLKTD